jgi:hypothetical protein
VLFNGEFMYRFVASIGVCHSVSHDILIPLITYTYKVINQRKRHTTEDTGNIK